MSDNYLLKMYQKAAKLPRGRRLFSIMFSRKAPYFGTIKPLIAELRPDYCKVTFKKRRAVENHIGTVHVIAICNAMEAAMGALAEASIPKHLRWIPKAWTCAIPPRPPRTSPPLPRSRRVPGKTAPSCR